MNGFCLPNKGSSSTASVGLGGNSKKISSGLSLGQVGGEYLVFSSDQGNTVPTNSSMQKEQKRKQSATYSTSFIKNLKPATLLSEGSDNGTNLFNSHRKSSSIVIQTQSTKSSSSGQIQQLLVGHSDKITPQQNNFYFPAAKKGNICKRGAFSTGDKIVLGSKPKPQNLGLVQMAYEQQQKHSVGMHTPQIVNSSRSQEGHFFDKKKPFQLNIGMASPPTSSIAFNPLSPPICSPPVIENDFDLISSEKNGNFVSSTANDESKLFAEIKRLQILQNQQKMKIDSLEKANYHQKELLKQKDLIIANLEEQQSLHSSLPHTSEITSQMETVSQNTQYIKVSSSENSFNGKEKFNFQDSASSQKQKQKVSPYQSLLYSTSLINNTSLNKKQQQLIATTTQKTLPPSEHDFIINSPKHKEKQINLNLNDSETKDFILRAYKNSTLQKENNKKDVSLQQQRGTNDLLTSPNNIAESLKMILERTKRLLEKKQQISIIKGNKKK